MVEVIINGVSIDLISKSVKYTKQVNDLADISTVNTSFTYSIIADKTPKNTQLFQGLGLIGDTSKIPYTKNITQLIDNGTVLINKGISTVKKTGEDYQLHIQDGIIEVFKLLENKTIGRDLELSELIHIKNAASIIDTWNNLNLEYIPYRYLIADYNGNTEEAGEINASYQIPSVSIKYLWDKIFESLGYTYSGNFNFINDKYMTYPKPPEIIEIAPEFSLFAVRNEYDGDYNDNYKNWAGTLPIPLVDVTIINNWKVKINQTGNYRIKFYGSGAMIYQMRSNYLDFFGVGRQTLPFRISLYVDGLFHSYVLSNTDNTIESFDIILQSNNILELIVSPITGEELSFDNNYVRNNIVSGDYTITNLAIDSIALEMSITGRENIDFQSALSDFSLTEFFKEVMIRGALTPFVDNITRHIKFKSLKERLNIIPSRIVNIENKYVNRISEVYSYGNYAQRNVFRLKYNNQDENYNDGYLEVENKNISSEKKLFESKFYSPERIFETLQLLSGTAIVPIVKLWDKEIKENNGIQEIEYKPLSNRFYMLTPKLRYQNITVNGVSSSYYYSAETTGTTFPEVINSSYAEAYRIFTDTRIHEIELSLGSYDFFSMDLDKIYYIEQQGQFYILNKLIWESGEISKGEFLRVKKV